MNKTMTVIAIVLLTVTALFAMVSNDSDGYSQGETVRFGTTDYYVITNAHNTRYTTAPSQYIYIQGTSIMDGAFRDCDNLREVQTSDTLTHIGNYAFAECNNLDCVVAGSATWIGSYAFADSNIRRVWVQPCLTYLGDHAYENCRNLSDMLTWQSSLTSFGAGTFKNSGLRVIDLRGITSLASDAFEGCDIRRQVVSPGQTTCIEGVDKLIGADRGLFANIYVQGSNMLLQSYGYIRVDAWDTDGNQVETTFYADYPWSQTSIPVEVGKDYYIGKMVYTVHYPEGLGLDDAEVESGGEITLPSVTLGDLTSSGWTIEGMDGTYTCLYPYQISRLGQDIVATPVFDDALMHFDHSDLPVQLDSSSLVTEMSFTYGTCYPDLGELDGYVHSGWTVDGTEYPVTGRVDVFSEHTAMSLWTPTVQVTVTYMQADGTVMSTDGNGRWRQVTVTDSVPEEAVDKRFVGWSLEGSPDTIVAGDVLTMEDDIVLEPVFDDRELFSIRFVKGDTVLSTGECYDGREFTISVSDPTETWRDFLYWKAGDELFVRGDSLTVTSDMTMQSMWRDVEKVSITYHIDPLSVIEYRKGSTAVIYEDPEHDDSVILSGWTMTSGSDTVDYVNGTRLALGSNIHLYPVWEDVPEPEEVPSDTPATDQPSVSPPVYRPPETEDPEPEEPSSGTEDPVVTDPPVEEDVPSGGSTNSTGKGSGTDTRTVAIGAATVVGVLAAVMLLFQIRRS